MPAVSGISFASRRPAFYNPIAARSENASTIGGENDFIDAIVVCFDAYLASPKIELPIAVCRNSGTVFWGEGNG